MKIFWVTVFDYKCVLTKNLCDDKDLVTFNDNLYNLLNILYHKLIHCYVNIRREKVLFQDGMSLWNLIDRLPLCGMTYGLIKTVVEME